MEPQNCVFCKIASGEIPSKKEYEDDEIFAFHDINPKAPIHVLVIPKKHIPRLVEVSEDDVEVLGRCQLVAAQVAKKLNIGDAFRVLTASGEAAGQSVFHTHYHIVGGWQETPEMEVKKEFP
ncbi:MAG: histidine triad nucleotide-binding protein [Candidatus Blackburnbacteria bacterium]|nr:histidine triad nucleotide-binding protein [Candidatus Blackburnbacteria bacterium]